MSENPYSIPPESPEWSSQPVLKGGLPSHIMEPLHSVAGWLTFLGWISIILGILYCLTIIGIVFGWLPIWIGLLLKGAADNLKLGFQTGNEAHFYTASKSLSTYFIILGVLSLLALIINLLYFGGLAIVFVLAIIAAANGG